MRDKTQTETAVEQRKTKSGDGNGAAGLTPQDVERLFEEGYREIEILPDGTLRETTANGDTVTEAVTRSLKTERTWY